MMYSDFFPLTKRKQKWWIIDAEAKLARNSIFIILSSILTIPNFVQEKDFQILKRQISLKEVFLAEFFLKNVTVLEILTY